jgi:CubicO group peptidase (beta-lactamase class C family)
MEAAVRPVHRLLAPALLLLIPLSSRAQTLNGRFLDAAIDSVVAAHMEDGRVAGLSVAVARGGDVLHHESYGYADVELHVQTPLDAVFEIGSVTKQFTSVMVLQLVEEGKLDLDEDIRTYLPDFDTGGRFVPLRRLLDHSSGMKGYTEMPVFGGLMVQALPRDSLLTLIENAPWDFEPGEAVIYNNSAYFLVGLILEAVTEKRYEDLVEERIFEPLGMERSLYCSNTTVVEDRAHGYDAAPDGLRRARYLDHRWPYSAGSLCSTARDLIRWNRALHGGEVLSAEMYELLVTPEALNDGTMIRYAKGVGHDHGVHGEVIAHGGGINGFLSDGRYYPDEALTVVVLQNTVGPSGPNAVSAGIVDLLLPKESEPQAVPFSGRLDALTGSYRGPSRGRPLQAVFAVEAGTLRASLNGSEESQALKHIGGGIFVASDDPWGPRVWFVDSEGRVVGTPGSAAPVEARFDTGGGHNLLARQPEG